MRKIGYWLFTCWLGSNMPCTPEAVDVLKKANVLIAPAMAAGAGGVRYSIFYSTCFLDAFSVWILK